jgi:hypothetical protein
MVDLIEQCRLACDELIDVTGHIHFTLPLHRWCRAGLSVGTLRLVPCLDDFVLSQVPKCEGPDYMTASAPRRPSRLVAAKRPRRSGGKEPRC